MFGSLKKAPSSFKPGAPLKDLFFPFKQRLLTHLRMKEETDADAAAVAFRRGQDTYVDAEQTLASAWPHTTELLNPGRCAIGWSEVAGSIASLRAVLDEGASLGVIDSTFSEQFGSLFKKHKVEQSFKLLNLNDFPDLPRSQATLEGAFKSILSFIGEMSNGEMDKKLRFLCRGGGACLIGGAQLTVASALLENPDVWVERATCAELSKKASFSGENGWEGKPQSMKRCVQCLASIVLERSDAERDRKGTPRKEKRANEGAKHALSLNFDSDDEPSRKRARKAAKALQQAVGAMEAAESDLDAKLLKVDLVKASKKASALTAAEEAYATLRGLYVELQEIDADTAADKKQTVRDMRKRLTLAAQK